jgi:hypothetical protein
MAGLDCEEARGLSIVLSKPNWCAISPRWMECIAVLAIAKAKSRRGAMAFGQP